MRKFVTTIFALALIAGAATGAQAQARRGTHTPGINHRERRQQRRIRQGVRSDELTRREALRLERGERRIRHNEREAREDGHVTARERARLQRELNHESHHIYRAKHNRRDRY
jgi:hypothetical protein